MTLSYKGLFATLIITAQPKHHYAECHILFIVIMSVVMLHVVMLQLVILSVVAPLHSGRLRTYLQLLH